MRYLDTNIFLRYLTEPVTDADRRKLAAGSALFERLSTGHEQVAVTEVIVAEVLYVLCSKALYALSHEEAAARLRPLLELPGLKLPTKRSYIRALALFAAHSDLDFEDAVLIAHMERTGTRELYSYDTDFDRIPGISRIEP